MYTGEGPKRSTCEKTYLDIHSGEPRVSKSQVGVSEKGVEADDRVVAGPIYCD